MHNSWKTTIACAVLVLAAAPSIRSAAQTGGKTASQRIGEFTIKNYARLSTTFGVNRIDADLSGPNLQISSANYDMAAPKIVMAAQRTTANGWRVTSADATGGVRIVIRRPEAQQTTTVTSNRAVYAATTDPKEPGRINLTGNVRSVTQDPTFVEPLVQNAESGVIELLGPNETRIELINGNLSVTPREPAPKPKPTPKK